MKFLTLAVVMLMTPSASAVQRRHFEDVTLLQTLPDERAETISDADIAAHEAARAEAAKVAVNPANEFFATVRANID